MAVLERVLWTLCRALIRAIYPNRCYTCGQAGLKGRNWQTGHLWPKASLCAFLKYDLRVLRPQCYCCNIDLGGNGAVYLERVIEEKGHEYVAELIKDKQVSVRARDHYQGLIVTYGALLKRTLSAKSPGINY